MCKTTKLGRMVTNYVTNENHFSTTIISVATKYGRGVTYHEGVPPIKSQGPWITWS